ncbi:Uu.00g122420.m01.CDS01 [Anthostomella pinea]|uniref:CST complex subunit STN1 n=1 Tax=Anthostomella pinea TaxID=933095 RepID=A0AAI8VH84_9PEZI|nr:Uu.00g122420.m01.CDS01 [Anthostomella pinea]
MLLLPESDVFFHLNHPIRWVRVTGVVVAIDEYYGRRIYTIDDSTGECIECALAIPKPPSTKLQNEKAGRSEPDALAATKGNISDTASDTHPVPEPTLDVDIGMVLEVRGSVKLFRDQKQIAIQTLQHIRSTEQEVQFWNKIRDFQRDVLSRPWVLKDREVRRWKKLQDIELIREEKESKKAKKMAEVAVENSSLPSRLMANSLGSHRRRPVDGYAPGRDKSGEGAKSRSMRAEHSSRIKRVKSYAEGQYDALGL